MTRIGVVLGCFLALTAGVMAQDEPLPDSVAQPYLAYETAMAAQDYLAASVAAARAWRSARNARIDPELVGILAENYGRLALARGQYEDAYDAWRAAAQISDRLRTPASERATRWYQASRAAFSKGDINGAQQCSMRASQAEASSDTPLDSQLSGDLHYMMAVTSSQMGRVRLVGEHARLALAGFAATERAYDRDYGNAYFLAGVGSLFDGHGAETYFDFYMARKIFAALVGPSRDDDLRSAVIWGEMAGMQMSGAELTRAEADIAASSFPRDDETAPVGGGDVANHDAQPIRRFEPRYPYSALEAGQEGVVIVTFSVTEEGRVDAAEITAAMPAGVFEQASLQAVAAWRYEPQVRDGVAVRRDDVETMFVFRMMN